MPNQTQNLAAPASLHIICGCAQPSGEPYTALVRETGNDLAEVLALHWGVTEPAHAHLDEHRLDEPVLANKALGEGWRFRVSHLDGERL